MRKWLLLLSICSCSALAQQWAPQDPLRAAIGTWMKAHSHASRQKARVQSDVEEAMPRTAPFREARAVRERLRTWRRQSLVVTKHAEWGLDIGGTESHEAVSTLT